MARCRCSGDSCTCALVAGTNTRITGAGTPSSPWQVHADPFIGGALAFLDGPSVDFTTTGLGTDVSPLLISAKGNVNPLIDFVASADLTPVVTGAGTEASPMQVAFELNCISCDADGDPGDVLVLQVDGTYLPQPVPVAPGSVNVTGSLTGDGSVATPIALNLCTYNDLKNACAP